MKKTIIIILIFLPIFTFAQELLCRVSVNYSQINTTNTQVFQALQRDITEFMNRTRWTSYVFGNKERIECSMLINITQYDGVDNFTASLQVSSNRPVYNASLTTPVLNLKEKDGTFKFRYIENQPIEFNESTFTSELAYTLAFYAYIIIGYDFDTFSEFGGTEFFEKAQQIVTNAQSSPNQASWKSIGATHEDNRYYLAKFINSPTYKGFREAQYKYHRNGIDLMVKDVTSGRQNIATSIGLIKKVYQKKPGNYLVQIWIETKRQEIINVFSESPPAEAKRVAEDLKLIDITNADQYDKMGTGR